MKPPHNVTFSALVSIGLLNSHYCMYWYGKLQQFMVQRCPKYESYQKKLQIKVVRIWISSKKVRERVCLPLHRVELGGSKDWKVPSIILYGKGWITFSSGLTAAKNTHRIKKKLQIKVVWNWILYKILPRALMSISHWGGARGLKKLAYLKYYSIGKTLPKIHMASKKA